MTRGLRAVFISPIAPAVTGNGLAMRMGQFVEALSKIADLHVIVVPVAGETGFRASSRAYAKTLIHFIDVGERADTHFSLLSRVADPRARLDAFRAYGKPSLARHLSAPVLGEIARRVEALRPDFVHLGRSYMLPCLNALPTDVALTLDLDEDDWASYAGQAQIARAQGDLAGADWLEQEGLACDRLIARWGRRLRKIFIANPADAPRLALRHPGLAWEAAENSVEIPTRRAKRDDGETLLFVGALGYRPNADGVRWFCEAVLPRLRAGSGGPCRLIIAGGGGVPEIAALARRPRVVVLGRVKDLGPLYRQATLALAPLHSGGGTRIKLLEAAAHRTASVSTVHAAAGIGWPREAGGWRGRTPLDFALACQSGLANATERDRRAAGGLDWVIRHHQRKRIVSRLARSFIMAVDRRPAEGVTEEILG